MHYKIVSQLGINHAQNRTTFLAEKNGEKFVLKKFSFSQPDSNWDQFKAIQREVKILQDLDHPQIPKYIENFEIDNDYYLVQEYINAKNITNFTLKTPKVWNIAKQLLSILDYLHSKNIIHKDIKPDNILWTGEKVYLIDFGFSSNISLKPGVSSTFLGTTNFIPPEQIFRGKISSQGDLYSLGVTLFCLFAQINSEQINNFVDEDYSFKLKTLDLDFDQKSWLNNLLATKETNRFTSAQKAINSLATNERQKAADNELWELKGKIIFQDRDLTQKKFDDKVNILIAVISGLGFVALAPIEGQIIRSGISIFSSNPLNADKILSIIPFLRAILTCICGGNMLIFFIQKHLE